jgi:hypothetical protein
MSFPNPKLCVEARPTLDDGHDGAHLDSRRALETVSVDAAKQLRLEVHLVERVDGLIVVRLDLSCIAKPGQPLSIFKMNEERWGAASALYRIATP